ncbi:unnamed protein product [Choristocarpus tenellus]
MSKSVNDNHDAIISSTHTCLVHIFHLSYVHLSVLPHFCTDLFCLLNMEAGMHTLCLLDIKVKEPDFAQMAKGKVRYLPPRFMTVRTALEQLLEVECRRCQDVYSPDSLCVGLARLGQSTQHIVAGKMSELLDVDFGSPLHSLVICGTTHPLEDELLKWHMASGLKQPIPPTRESSGPEVAVEVAEIEGAWEEEGGKI